ncbi:hypothetical protein Tco_0440306, partial [Tanacetum coccineum]
LEPVLVGVRSDGGKEMAHHRCGGVGIGGGVGVEIVGGVGVVMTGGDDVDGTGGVNDDGWDGATTSCSCPEVGTSKKIHYLSKSCTLVRLAQKPHLIVDMCLITHTIFYLKRT